VHGIPWSCHFQDLRIYFDENVCIIPLIHCHIEVTPFII
jgi:hypothetical protein